MARPFPNSNSTLKDIVLYILEGRGEIADNEIGMRRAAAALTDGKAAPTPAITLNYLLGNRPQTTQADIKKAGWEANLRRVSKARFTTCILYYNEQLRMLPKNADAVKAFKLPENFAETVLAMIGGEDNIQSAAQKMDILSADLRDFAINGRIPVSADSINTLVTKLETAFPEEAWLSPLLRVFAEKNLTVSQAKKSKKENVELFRQVAREVLVDMRKQLGLQQADVEKRLREAAAGRLRGDDNIAISVAGVAVGKVRAFEADEKMGDSVFVSCVRSFANVMYLERNNPRQLKLLNFLASAISP